MAKSYYFHDLERVWVVGIETGTEPTADDNHRIVCLARQERTTTGHGVA